jgi:hypothetical protein
MSDMIKIKNIAYLLFKLGEVKLVILFPEFFKFFIFKEIIDSFIGHVRNTFALVVWYL